MTKKVFLASAIAGLLACGAAMAQVATIPQVQSVGPSDLFQDVVGGYPQAQSSYVSGAVLGGTFGQGENFLIGGG